jgi:hypothetical protein
MTADFSDLQVVPESEYTGLQKNPNSSQTELDTYKIKDDREQGRDVRYKMEDASNGDHPDEDTRRICGLKRKNFLIAAAIAILLIVGAGIGGGVGGTLSQKHSNNGDSKGTALPSAVSSNDSTTATSTPAPSLTTTQVVGPSATLLRDCPSSNNTVYDVSFDSSRYTFRKFCNLSLLNSNHIANAINTPTKSLDDCINLCATYNMQNKTEIGHGTSIICNAVCWRNTFDPSDDFPGECFGYTTQNSSNTFAFQEDARTTICDAAALINQ